jgi:hypothetical protein
MPLEQAPTWWNRIPPYQRDRIARDPNAPLHDLAQVIIDAGGSDDLYIDEFPVGDRGNFVLHAEVADWIMEHGTD